VSRGSVVRCVAFLKSFSFTTWGTYNLRLVRCICASKLMIIFGGPTLRGLCFALSNLKDGVIEELPRSLNSQLAQLQGMVSQNSICLSCKTRDYLKSLVVIQLLRPVDHMCREWFDWLGDRVSGIATAFEAPLSWKTRSCVLVTSNTSSSTRQCVIIIGTAPDNLSQSGSLGEVFGYQFVLHRYSFGKQRHHGVKSVHVDLVLAYHL